MATTTKKAGKGITDGVVSEMSTFFHIKPRQEAELKAATQRFVEVVKGLDPKDGIKTGLRDSRHVIFDEGRQLLWVTTFETEWDVYMDDAISVVGFKHFLDWMKYTVEGDEFAAWAEASGGVEALDPNNPDVDRSVGQHSGGMKRIIQSVQIPAAAYFNSLSPVTLSQAGKAAQLAAAFQEVLDNPEAEQALQHPALKPLLDQASS